MYRLSCEPFMIHCWWLAAPMLLVYEGSIHCALLQWLKFIVGPESKMC
jgi:hypothetical protein